MWPWPLMMVNNGLALWQSRYETHRLRIHALNSNKFTASSSCRHSAIDRAAELWELIGWCEHGGYRIGTEFSTKAINTLTKYFAFKSVGITDIFFAHLTSIIYCLIWECAIHIMRSAFLFRFILTQWYCWIFSLSRFSTHSSLRKILGKEQNQKNRKINVKKNSNQKTLKREWHDTYSIRCIFWFVLCISHDSKLENLQAMWMMAQVTVMVAVPSNALKSATTEERREWNAFRAWNSSSDFCHWRHSAHPIQSFRACRFSFDPVVWIDLRAYRVIW